MNWEALFVPGWQFIEKPSLHPQYISSYTKAFMAMTRHTVSALHVLTTPSLSDRDASSSLPTWRHLFIHASAQCCLLYLPQADVSILPSLCAYSSSITTRVCAFHRFQHGLSSAAFKNTRHERIPVTVLIPDNHSELPGWAPDSRSF